MTTDAVERTQQILTSGDRAAWLSAALLRGDARVWADQPDQALLAQGRASAQGAAARRERGHQGPRPPGPPGPG
jgi:hypothetical protein